MSWRPIQGTPDGSVEIILASWGTLKFDKAFLETVPNLKMVAYAAGTIKKIVTDDNKDNFIKLRDEPVGFNGLNVGLVGASYAGREVIRLLGSYNVKVAVYDPYLTPEDVDKLGVDKMELNQLVAWADVVSVHVHKLPETQNLIGSEQFELMKDGSFFINTARGTIVDYEALAEITPQKNIEVVIDVTDPYEPLPESSPLRKLDNILTTPHIAGSRGNEQQLMGTLAIEEIKRCVSGKPLLYEVDQEDFPRIA